MLKKLRDRFSKLKKRTKSLMDSREKLNKIKITNKDGLGLVEIKDYITSHEYLDEKEVLENSNILDKISFNIMWDSLKQKISKGTYYVTGNDEVLYNFLINGSDIVIDERIKINDVTEERIIRYNQDIKIYRYTSFKHDKNGSTFYMKFYSKSGAALKAVELDKEVAFQEISTILSNLEKINVIGSIVDLSILRENILDDFGIDFLGQSKKKI